MRFDGDFLHDLALERDAPELRLRVLFALPADPDVVAAVAASEAAALFIERPTGDEDDHEVIGIQFFRRSRRFRGWTSRHSINA